MGTGVVEQAIQVWLANLNAEQPIVVGLSGGVDSVVLLHGLRQAVKDQRLSAIHVNHRLQTDCDQWQAFCRSLCEQWQVPVQESFAVVEKQARQGWEQSARQARYDVFTRLMPMDGVLCLAHHQQDQAETLLLRLMRGTGLTGLAGMAVCRRQDHYHVHRPLLSVSKADILRYAQVHGLRWIEDPSNGDETLQRNWVRHRLLPLLRQRQPQMDGVLGRVANHLSDAQQVLDEVATADLAEQLQTRCMDASRLVGSNERKKMAVMMWLRFHVGYAPSSTLLNRVMVEMVLNPVARHEGFGLGKQWHISKEKRRLCLRKL